ncbi:DUF4012 domain-containing protein [Candidatus Roizmanbacteria bacterium]|nr:DUF4012 domain-containing protein [Candidatus Roizmanbacteria bacterium]
MAIKLKTEYYSTVQKILIVDKGMTPLSAQLKHELKRYENEIYVSPQIPQSLSPFSLCFLIDPPPQIFRALHAKHPPCILIIPSSHKQAEKMKESIAKRGDATIKIVSITSLIHATPQDIDNILWFTFSKSDETFLYIHHPLPPPKNKIAPSLSAKTNKTIRRLHLIFHPKTIPFLLISLFLIIHFLFIPPLLTSFFFIYSATKSFTAKDIVSVKKQTELARSTSQVSKKIYLLVRPTFLILSLVSIPDGIFQVNEAATTVLTKSVPLSQNTTALLKLILKQNKDKNDFTQIQTLKDSITSDEAEFSQSLNLLYQKAPDWIFKKKKEEIKKALSYLEIGQKLLFHFDTFFAKDTKKTYLFLFANNMELRPGGGFIGSFGVVSVHNYTIDPPIIYDVYDADGQLKSHIEPPLPIRLYLSQPDWFLRDSAFSPDFNSNYQQAKLFLKKEMKLTSFDGAFLITTTAIQNSITAFNSLYIPDFKELVTKDNFYLKAQLYAEKNFFPGSLQKKRFLGAVLDQILIQIEDVSFSKLAEAIKTSLDEKQIVMAFEDPELQKTITSLYWSGQTIHPTCSSSKQNCVLDYLMPVDANLGVNKTNFYIQRSLQSRVSIDESGTITNRFTAFYQNQSLKNIFPGGTYKNYFQLFLPKDAHVTRVSLDESILSNYDNVVQNDYQSVGFLMQIPPQGKSIVAVEYQLSQPLQKGGNVYQLITQKQIGTANTEFSFSFSLPSKTYIMNQNFSPLVKGNSIIYNTTITNDKIFFLELLKE